MLKEIGITVVKLQLSIWQVSEEGRKTGVYFELDRMRRNKQNKEAFWRSFPPKNKRYNRHSSFIRLRWALFGFQEHWVGIGPGCETSPFTHTHTHRHLVKFSVVDRRTRRQPTWTWHCGWLQPIRESDCSSNNNFNHKVLLVNHGYAHHKKGSYGDMMRGKENKNICTSSFLVYYVIRVNGSYF